MQEEKGNQKFSLINYLRIILFGSKKEDYYKDDGILTYRDPYDPVVKAYVFPKLKKINDTIPNDGSLTLLDVGCGNGTFTVYLKEMFKTYGTDYSIKMLSNISGTLPLALSDAHDLPFKASSFDVVFESNMIHHIDNETVVLEEMTRLSRKYIILIEPNIFNPPMALFSMIHKPDRKLFKLRFKKLKSFLKNRGFHCKKTIRTGMVFQNATPRFLLPFLKIFDINFPIGAYTILVFEKSESMK
ncbi:class I SAM-dependent methyltransferase [candidate division KSB1 bacterium]